MHCNSQLLMLPTFTIVTLQSYIKQTYDKLDIIINSHISGKDTQRKYNSEIKIKRLLPTTVSQK